MRKMKLEIDTLDVQSFPTDDPRVEARGTVEAREASRTFGISHCTCPGNGISCGYACITVYDPDCF